MKRTDRIAAMLALVTALAAPAHVGAQDVEEAGGSLLFAAIGAGAGLVGGGYANLVGGGLGFAIGFWDHDRLWPWILGGAAGLGAGAGTGYLSRCWRASTPGTPAGSP